MDELQPILMRIAAATGYTLEQVKIKDRHKEIVLAREIYVSLHYS